MTDVTSAATLPIAVRLQAGSVRAALIDRLERSLGKDLATATRREVP